MLRSDDAAALKDLIAHAMAGSRTYVLVPPAWGKGQVDPQLLKTPRILLRRVAEVPATAVHLAGGARLLLGGAWSLRLDAAQADALRHTFLRLFWHEATEEAWSGGQQLAWRVAGERPFDVPELPRDASVRLVTADTRLDTEARGGLIHLAGGTPPEATPRRLWFSAGADHHDRLARLVRSGTDVVWHDRGLPDLVVDANGGALLLAGARARLRVTLTPAQAADAARLLDVPGGWTFGVDLRVGDPATRAATFWLPGEVGARNIEAEQVIEVPEVAAPTLRAMPEAAPASVPAPQVLALSVRYQWTVVPPRQPAGAEEDALVGRWRKLDEDWTARLGRLREALQTIEGDRGRIGRVFSRLVSAMLGFERTQGGLLAQVAAMEAQRPSVAGPSTAGSMLSRLADVEEQARKLQGDLEDAERKARDDEEREKQEAAWRSRLAATNSDLAARREALASAERRRPAISEELASIEEALKTADKDAKKDLSAGQRKLSDELTRANKEVTRLRGEISDLEARAAERFEFRPSALPNARPSQPGGRFVPATASARPASPVPDEALPEAGVLRSHKGQRYLVIQTWAELTAGEQAANRLSAKLVAPENA